MPTCSDRQLVQSQLEQGFSQSRQGVVRAVRPFSGQASPEALVDYINRELFPAVKAGREKLNEVYLQVADNAPSANPLSYFFSTNTANADPTRGRMRLNAAVQNTATVLRVSELNAQLQSAVAWLDVMQGSSTTPIGVVTLNDRSNPGRFIRWNLNTMTDNGSYWDLGVTPVESSHDNPFVDGGPVVVSFIAGVASGGAVPAPPAVTNRQIGLVSHIGGNAVSSVSRLAFSNANNVTWSLSTAPNAATVIASVAAGGGGADGGVFASAAGSSQTAGQVVWSNSNNISFGMAGSTITANAFIASLSNLSLIAQSFSQASISSTVAGGPLILPGAFGGFASRDLRSNNVQFALIGNSLLAAAWVNALGNGGPFSVPNISFSDANNVSWGIASLTTNSNQGRIAVVTASVTVASTADPQIGLVSHIGGNSVSSVTRLVLSNASNVTWSLSTAANAATIIASVAAGGGGGITALALSNAASAVSATGITFSNANGFSFLLSTAAGNAATISGSYTVPTVPTHTLAVSAAGNSISNGTFVLSNANGVSFGMAGSTITASQSTLSFSNANNVTFGLAGSTLTASVTVASTQGSIRITAGATNNLVSNFSFSNGSNISFGLNGSTITASVDPEIGLLSHIGGNSVADATRLAFSNLNNVTFGLSTAAGGATLTASVAPAVGGGGVAVSAAGSSQSAGTVVWSNANNMSFGMNGSTITGQPFMFVSEVGANSVNATRIALGNNIVLTSGASAATLHVDRAGLSILALAASGQTATTGTVNFSNATFLTAITSVSNAQNVLFALDSAAGQMGASAFQKYTINGTTTGGFAATKLNLVANNGITFNIASSSDAEGRYVNISASVAAPIAGTMNWWKNFNIDGDNEQNVTFGVAQFWVSPLDGFGVPWPAQFTVSTLDVLLQAGSFSSTQSTGSFGISYFGALYTLVNSTQLSRVNKFTVNVSSTTQSFSARQNTFGGLRWLTVHSSLWDSQPVLSQGVQYWYGWGISTAGASVITAAIGQQHNQDAAFRGVFGVNQSTTQASGFAPFWGVVAAASPPASIGTANLVSANSSQRDVIPALQMRADIALA